jgi:hypothetical protein
LCNAQNIGDRPYEKADKFSQGYSEKLYLEDLNEFVKTITETHPYPYEFTSKEKFWHTVEEKKSLINDETSYGEFLWHCSEIMANLGCSHSSLGWFNQEDEILPIHLRFPIETRLVEDRLYISDPLVNKDILNAGVEIFSINGIPIEVIKENAYRHINSQAHVQTYKSLLFNGYSTAYIPYVLEFPKKYSIVVRGKKEPIQLKHIEDYKAKSRYNRITSDNLCQEELCFNISGDKKIGVLTIKNFAYYGDRFPIFKTFIDESFAEIKSRKIKNLIVDLRFNLYRV